MDSSPLLTKAEVRERLHVSRATLDRLIAAGDLPVIKLGGRIVRISHAAVEAYIESSAA